MYGFVAENVKFVRRQIMQFSINNQRKRMYGFVAENIKLARRQIMQFCSDAYPVCTVAIQKQ